MSTVGTRWSAKALPRDLHPAAWWVWALGLAAAASATTNPLLLALIVAVAGLVVAARRSDAPWALSFRLYLLLGLFVVAMRVIYRIIFGGGDSGGGDGPHVLVTLPQVVLPSWAAGIRLLGPVSAESLLAGLYDGMRLAALIICIGAANALANPKRLLRAVPSALQEVATAVVVAIAVFPQLAESVQRVRRARRLRGGTAGPGGAVRSVVVPVLSDALDRSLQLAASMDSRGYGRRGDVSRSTVLVNGFLVIAGLCSVCIGIYGFLDSSVPRWLGAPMLGLGLAAATLSLVQAGRRSRRTRYRPDRWGLAETLTAASGVLAAAGLTLALRADPALLHPPISPPAWPSLGLLTAAAVLVALLPAVLTPRRAPGATISAYLPADQPQNLTGAPR